MYFSQYTVWKVTIFCSKLYAVLYGFLLKRSKRYEKLYSILGSIKFESKSSGHVFHIVTKLQLFLRWQSVYSFHRTHSKLKKLEK
jgi:hypothetical protein